MLYGYGIQNLASKICIEYGCGLGRVTLPLAKRFKKIHAYDISPSHLAVARQRAAELEIRNAEFHLRSEDFLADLEKCDFFYSTIVFQHNPPPIIRELIGNALRSLQEGGLAIFQIPVYEKDYSFRLDDYLRKLPILDMEMHCLPQAEIFALVAEARCTILEVREDGRTGPGNLSNMFVVQRGASPR